jgi:hypothetical protein
MLCINNCFTRPVRAALWLLAPPASPRPRCRCPCGAGCQPSTARSDMLPTSCAAALPRPRSCAPCRDACAPCRSTAPPAPR